LIALNEFADLPFDGCELAAGARDSRAMLHPQPIQLAHVFVAEVLEQVPAHQLVAKGRQDTLFHLLAADRQAIGARASRTSPGAGQAVAPIHHVSAAALSAFRQPGEEILRAPD
jgi:hypothetical protein